MAHDKHSLMDVKMDRFLGNVYRNQLTLLFNVIPWDSFDNEDEFMMQFQYLKKPEMDVKFFATIKNTAFFDINSIVSPEIAALFDLGKFAAR